MSAHRGAAIAATLAIHAALLALFASSISQKTPLPPEKPPIVVQLIKPASVTLPKLQPAPPEAPKPKAAQPTPAPAPLALPAPPVKPTPPVTVPVPVPAPATLKPTEPMPVASLPQQAPPVRSAPQLPVPAPAPLKPAESLVAPTPTPTQQTPVVTSAPSQQTPTVTQPVSPTQISPPTLSSDGKTDPSISATYSASNPKPVYPPMSIRWKEQGRVVLRVLVKSDGSAGEVKVESSSGYPRLDSAAVDTIKSWRFNPATVNGKPIDAWYPLPYEFKIQK